LSVSRDWHRIGVNSTRPDTFIAVCAQVGCARRIEPKPRGKNQMASTVIPFWNGLSSKLVLLAALTLATSTGVWAQNNSYATMLQNNAIRQANLTQQMINLGGSPTTGSGGGTSPASCMPPYELQRGFDGHVPPELQGDPRYQAYLRCRQGQAGPQSVRSAPVVPSLPAGPHLPITATDFTPVQQGHPMVDQAIANLTLTPEQRLQLRNGVEEMFRRVAARYRGNNVAVSVAVAYSTAMLALNGVDMNDQQTRELVFSVNDKLARNPRFAAMSPVEKQNDSDGLIFQSVIISVLRDMGTRDPQARQQSMELARVVLKQLNGA
jgi:hypothetical protein